MFKKLKLRAKMLVILIIPITALAFSLLSSINILQTVSTSYVRSLYDECYQSSVLILNADRDLYQVINAFYQLMNAESTDKVQSITTTLNENLQGIDERLAEAEKTLKGN